MILPIAYLAEENALCAKAPEAAAVLKQLAETYDALRASGFGCQRRRAGNVPRNVDREEER